MANNFVTAQNPILPGSFQQFAPWPTRYSPETGEIIPYRFDQGNIPAGLGQDPILLQQQAQEQQKLVEKNIAEPGVIHLEETGAIRNVWLHPEEYAGKTIHVPTVTLGTMVTLERNPVEEIGTRYGAKINRFEVGSEESIFSVDIGQAPKNPEVAARIFPNEWTSTGVQGEYVNLALLGTGKEKFNFPTTDMGKEVIDVVNTGAFKENVFSVELGGKKYAFDVTEKDMLGIDAFSNNPKTGNILIEEKNVTDIGIITHEIEHRLNPTLSESEITSLTSRDLPIFSGILTPQLISLGMIKPVIETPISSPMPKSLVGYEDVFTQQSVQYPSIITETPKIESKPSLLEKAIAYNPFTQTTQPAQIATPIVMETAPIITLPKEEKTSVFEQAITYNPFQNVQAPIETSPIIIIPKENALEQAITYNPFQDIQREIPTPLIQTPISNEIMKVGLEKAAEGQTYNPFTETYIPVQMSQAPKIDITSDIEKMIGFGEQLAIQEYETKSTNLAIIPEGSKVMESFITMELPKTTEFQSVLYKEPIITETGEMSIGGVLETTTGGTMTQSMITIKSPEEVKKEETQQIDFANFLKGTESLDKSGTSETLGTLEVFATKPLTTTLTALGDVFTGKPEEFKSYIAEEKGKLDSVEGFGDKISYVGKELVSEYGGIALSAGTGFIVGKGLAVATSVSTKVGNIGEGLLVTAGLGAVGLEAFKVKSEISAGVPSNIIVTDILKTGVEFAAFGGGFKAGAKKEVEILAEGFKPKTVQLAIEGEKAKFFTTVDQYSIVKTKAPIDVNIFGKEIKIGNEKIDTFIGRGEKEGIVTQVKSSEIQDAFTEQSRSLIKVADQKGKIVYEEFSPESFGKIITGGKKVETISETGKGYDITYGTIETIIPKEFSMSIEATPKKLIGEIGKTPKITEAMKFEDVGKAMSRETSKITYKEGFEPTITLKKTIEGGFLEKDIGKLKEFTEYDIVSFGKDRKTFGKGEIFIPKEEPKIEFKSDYGTSGGKRMKQLESEKRDFGKAFKESGVRLSSEMSNKVMKFMKTETTGIKLGGFGGASLTSGVMSIGRGKEVRVSIAKSEDVGVKNMITGAFIKGETRGIGISTSDAFGKIGETRLIETTAKTTPIKTTSIFETPSLQESKIYYPIETPTKTTSIISSFSENLVAPTQQPTLEFTMTPTIQTTTPSIFQTQPFGSMSETFEESKEIKPTFSLPSTLTSKEDTNILSILSTPKEEQRYEKRGISVGEITITPVKTTQITSTLTDIGQGLREQLGKSLAQKTTETSRSYTGFSSLRPPYLPPGSPLRLDFGSSGGLKRRKDKKMKIPKRYTPSLVGTIFAPRIKKAPKEVGIQGIGIRPQLISGGKLPERLGLKPPKSAFASYVSKMFTRKPKNPQNEIAKKKYNDQFMKNVLGR